MCFTPGNQRGGKHFSYRKWLAFYTETVESLRSFSKERGRIKAEQTRTDARCKLSTAFKKTLIS